MAPSTHRALLITSQTAAPSVVSRPTPVPTTGTVLLRMFAVPMLSYAREIYPPNNTRNYPYPLPMVPGSGGIGRVEALPPDSSLALKEGQLVLLSSYVRGREDNRGGPNARYLLELNLAPVECVFAMDEKRLLGKPEQGGLGLDEAQISAALPRIAVPFGGLRSVNLKPGETVAVAPATGMFGGAAVMVALSMGARVIAMGRSTEKLEALKKLAQKVGKSAQLRTVQVTGDVQKDAASLRTEAGMGGLDVFYEISPPAAAAGGVTPSFITSGIAALRTGGRVSLQGGIRGNIEIDFSRVMHADITIQGKWMYDDEDVRDLIKMMEAGVLPVHWVDVVGRYPLDQWEAAWNMAAEKSGAGESTVIEPQK